MGTEADAAAGGGGGGSSTETTIKTTKKQQQQPLSKRERRKHVNPSNTWPQQPKIQTPAARAKANLRVAGLLNTTKSNSASSLDPTLDLHSPEVKFGRILGAPEQRRRHLAVTHLQSYLKQRCEIHSSHGISELDLLKLWKALWYTLYLADKVPVQEELSKRLAKLLWCVAGTEEEDEYAAQMYLDMCNQQDDEIVMEEIVNTIDGNEEEEVQEESSQVDEEEQQEENDESSGSDEEHGHNEQQLLDPEDEDVPDELIQHCRGAHLAALFVKTFFRTIQREWGKMDKHRIDKFYTLVRLMLREIFSYMAARHWNRGIIFLFNDVIRDEVLFQVPNGLRCHLIDICISELATVNAKAPMPLTEATLVDCLDPYFALAQNCDDSMVHGRVVENVFGKFLNEYSIVSEKEDNKEMMDQVHVGTIAKFLFELGSDVDTQERYRKPLYNMHKTYMKRIKKVGKDVELDVESSDENEDEMVDDRELEQEEDVETRNRKRKASKRVDDEVNETIATEETKQAHKKKRKKNKQETKDVEEVTMEQASVPEATEEEPHTEKKKSKKRKKKKRKSSISSDEGSLGSKGDTQEEVITISYMEQKIAAKDMAEQDETASSSKKKKRKATKTPNNSPKTPELTSEEKRVKFGRVNQSKSYKASMKALKTVKHTPNKTPDHGILKTKIGSSSSSSSSQKKGRKKATDYF